MGGIDESSRRFADFALEVFYIDFIEAGCSRKAPFVIRTKDQWEMFQKSSCTSLSVRVIQREVTGCVNIVLRQNRQDNTMDRAGTLPLNLYETETVLKPVNLNSMIGVERVPSESDEPPNSNEDASLPPESPNNERLDSFSASDSDSDSDSDSEEEVDSALETMNMIRPTRLRRVRTLTSRMADFQQAGMAGM